MGSSNMIVWKTLEALLIEIQKRNVQIPVNILEDLRAAKFMVELSCNETVPKETMTKAADVYLTNVEAYLIYQAQKIFEPSVVDKWLICLKEASSQMIDKKIGVCQDRSVAGVPRSQQWIRIEPDDKLSEEHILKLAGDWCLTVNKQTDGRLAIYGQLPAVKAFIRQITAEKSV